MQNATHVAGAPDTSKKGRKSGIETLEQALGDYYDQVKGNVLHYDAIQKFDAIGATVWNKHAVRDEQGRIDILATFRKAGVNVDTRILAQAAQVQGGLF